MQPSNTLLMAATRSTTKASNSVRDVDSFPLIMFAAEAFKTQEGKEEEAPAIASTQDGK